MWEVWIDKQGKDHLITKEAREADISWAMSKFFTCAFEAKDQSVAEEVREAIFRASAGTSVVAITKVQVYFVDAATGCSCCMKSNFRAGPFLTLEDAEQRKKLYHDTCRLVSQYSARGIYTLCGPYEAERLSDGRIIYDDAVYSELGEERPDY